MKKNDKALQSCAVCGKEFPLRKPAGRLKTRGFS
jgi:hypothetical protein